MCSCCGMPVNSSPRPSHQPAGLPHSGPANMRFARAALCAAALAAVPLPVIAVHDPPKKKHPRGNGPRPPTPAYTAVAVPLERDRFEMLSPGAGGSEVHTKPSNLLRFCTEKNLVNYAVIYSAFIGGFTAYFNGFFTGLPCPARPVCSPL